jgi:GNAT superfamily N-acetyltransferase
LFMLRVRQMTTDDLEFAVNITRTMDWNLEKNDFLFMMELEPEGCYVLVDDEEKIGLATNVSFGAIAWFGNLIVKKNCRGMGGGSLLVRHSLSHLQKKGVRTLGLYAYTDKIPFYERLGFKKDVQYLVLHCKPHSSPVKADLVLARTSEEFRDVIDFDSRCFGESREKSLEPIISDSDNRCYTHKQNGRIDGYVVAKVSKNAAEIGPLVCGSGRNDLMADLLRKMLNELDGREVALFVSEKEVAILGILEDFGFHEKFRLARMFFGKPLVDRCLCLPESLERG